MSTRFARLLTLAGFFGLLAWVLLWHLWLSPHPDLAPWLRDTRLPVQWISGNRDHKFHALACQLVKQGCNIKHLALDGGHNLHTSQPDTFARLLREWAHQPEEKIHD